jgi:hypothetical protein
MPQEYNYYDNRDINPFPLDNNIHNHSEGNMGFYNISDFKNSSIINSIPDNFHKKRETQEEKKPFSKEDRIRYFTSLRI